MQTAIEQDNGAHQKGRAMQVCCLSSAMHSIAEKPEVVHSRGEHPLEGYKPIVVDVMERATQRTGGSAHGGAGELLGKSGTEAHLQQPPCSDGASSTFEAYKSSGKRSTVRFVHLLAVTLPAHHHKRCPVSNPVTYTLKMDLLAR